MNNKLAVTMIALMAIGLGLSSIVPSVMADSKGKKQDIWGNNNIHEDLNLFIVNVDLKNRSAKIVPK